MSLSSTWGWRRVGEIWATTYVACSGALFMARPDALSAPVYDGFRAVMSASDWGGWMLCIAALHAFALWLNGCNKIVSSCIRVFACFSHSVVCFSFVFLFFEAGALWGAVTYSMVTFFLFGAIQGALLKLMEGKHACG